MNVVEIGQWASSDDEKDSSDFRYQSLILFLYSVYSNFFLENNSLETFIGPRDEKNVLLLALTKMKPDADVCFKFAFRSTILYFDICVYVLFSYRLIS